MTGPEHYRAADALLADLDEGIDGIVHMVADDAPSDEIVIAIEMIDLVIRRAQAHSAQALVAITWASPDGQDAAHWNAILLTPDD